MHSKARDCSSRRGERAAALSGGAVVIFFFSFLRDQEINKFK